jgi:hypothetical protein
MLQDLAFKIGLKTTHPPAAFKYVDTNDNDPNASEVVDQTPQNSQGMMFQIQRLWKKKPTLM